MSFIVFELFVLLHANQYRVSGVTLRVLVLLLALSVQGISSSDLVIGQWIGRDQGRVVDFFVVFNVEQGVGPFLGHDVGAGHALRGHDTDSVQARVGGAKGCGSKCPDLAFQVGNLDTISSQEGDKHDGDNAGNDDEDNGQDVGLLGRLIIGAVARVKAIVLIQGDAVANLGQVRGQLRIHFLILSVWRGSKFQVIIDMIIGG